LSFRIEYEIGVIGAGAWGTTLAAYLTKSGRSVLLWAYEETVRDEINTSHRNSMYLPGFELPDDLDATTRMEDFRSIDRLIIAIPSMFYVETIDKLEPFVSTATRILSATKGFIDSDLTRPSQFLDDAIPENHFGVISGPNLSREIMAGLPAISLVASRYQNLISEFQNLLSGEYFRVYGGTDVAGTELGGALKNIIAVAAGIADGLQLGENALAAIITRGLAEMIKLGEKLGAESRTFFGVSGLGDLVCTSHSTLSRNHELGRRIALGESLDSVTSSLKSIAEGVGTTKHVHTYAMKNGIELPITHAVYKMLFEKADPDTVIRELMTRTLKME